MNGLDDIFKPLNAWGGMTVSATVIKFGQSNRCKLYT